MQLVGMASILGCTA